MFEKERRHPEDTRASQTVSEHYVHRPKACPHNTQTHALHSFHVVAFIFFNLGREFERDILMSLGGQCDGGK